MATNVAIQGARLGVCEPCDARQAALLAENLLRRHIRPAAKRCGIDKQIGWHTFRHSYATHLKANGEDVKVVQESLRHANSRITLDTYTQALTTAKREAQTKVVKMILPERTHTAVAEGGK